MSTIRKLGPKAKEIISRDKEFVSPSYPRAYDFVMTTARAWMFGMRMATNISILQPASRSIDWPPSSQSCKGNPDQAEKFLHISSDFYTTSWLNWARK